MKNTKYTSSQCHVFRTIWGCCQCRWLLKKQCFPSCLPPFITKATDDLDSKLFHISSTKDPEVLSKYKSSLVVRLILVNTTYKLNVMDLEWRPQGCNSLFRLSITKPANTQQGTTGHDTTHSRVAGEFWLRMTGQVLNFKIFLLHLHCLYIERIPRWSHLEEASGALQLSLLLKVGRIMRSDQVAFTLFLETSKDGGCRTSTSNLPQLDCHHHKETPPWALNLKCNMVCFIKIPNHGVQRVETSPSSWPNFENDSSYQDFAYPLPDHPYGRAWRTDLHNTLKRPSATKQCMSFYIAIF